MPDDSMRLSPAGARACLRFEQDSKQLDAAQDTARAETRKLEAIQGLIVEERAACDAKVAKLTRSSIELELRIERLERRRWWWFAGGATATAAVVLMIRAIAM